jgi:hypothetical protein
VSGHIGVGSCPGIGAHVHAPMEGEKMGIFSGVQIMPEQDGVGVGVAGARGLIFAAG